LYIENILIGKYVYRPLYMVYNKVGDIKA